MDEFFKAVGMVVVGGFALLALVIAVVFSQAAWALLTGNVHLEINGVIWRRGRWPWRWHQVPAPRAANREGFELRLDTDEPQHQGGPS